MTYLLMYFVHLVSNHLHIYILILWVLLVCQDHVDCYAIGYGRSRVITCHSREIGKILLLLLYYYHMEYIYIYIRMIIGDRAEWYFGSGLGLAFERGSDCTCSAYVDWGPSVAVDGSQVTHIILSTYLLMWAERLVTLLSWVLTLFEPTDWRWGKVEV